MVVDSFSVLAILFRAPQREMFLEKLSFAKVKLVPAFSVYEMSVAFPTRLNFLDVDEFLASFRITIVPFETKQDYLAREAYARYGMGRDKASLNLGDCCTDALAKQTGHPLLFKGNDFAQTALPAA